MPQVTTAQQLAIALSAFRTLVGTLKALGVETSSEGPLRASGLAANLIQAAQDSRVTHLPSCAFEVVWLENQPPLGVGDAVLQAIALARELQQP